MGICPRELQHYVIRPTLKYLGEYSVAAEMLLIATAAIESELGFHLKNHKSSGLGVFRITPHTHKQVWDKYLAEDPDLASLVRGLASQQEFLSRPHLELSTNLRYATAIAWMVYRRAGQKLPDHDNIRALAKFWRQHFHSRPHATIESFIEHYHRLIDSQHLAA